MQKITPFLWFDGKAEAAVNFYTSIFKNSKIINIKHWGEGGPFPKDQVMTAEFELNGLKFYAFDAGPQFKINPSISFFAIFETESEVDSAWKKLSEGGMALMPLDKYPWSEKYGWCQDKFGVSWQMMMGKTQGQTIVPSLMFTKENSGKAEDAINLYTSVFKNSEIKNISRYEKGEQDVEGYIKYAEFILGNQKFAAMDSSGPHQFTFSEAISLYVDCKDQEEIDYFWNKLTSNGGQESMCGWLKDKFGVSWQIVPPVLPELLNDKDKVKAGRVMQAMMKMKKIIIADLEKAAELVPSGA